MSESEFYHEPEREIPIVRRVDVVVAGGGLAGVAAAVAAARNGARTLIVEREGVFGGVTTVGLMTAIGNQYFDRTNQQVIHGLPEEIARRLEAANGYSIQDWSVSVPKIVSQPEVQAQVLAEMLEEAGVEMLTHAMVVGVIKSGAAVQGLLLESKSGRQAVMARVTVDATGDADVAVLAGAPVVTYSTRSDSLVYRAGNVDLQRTYEYLRQHRDEWPAGSDAQIEFGDFERNWLQNGLFHYPHHGGLPKDFQERAAAAGKLVRSYGRYVSLDAYCIDGMRATNTCSIVTGHIHNIDNTDQWTLTGAELEGRKAAFVAHRALQEALPGFEGSFVSHVAHTLGVRLSRHIVGRTAISTTQAKEGARFADTIGLAVHIPATKNPAHDIPFGVLIPLDVENLLNASGKSSSVAEAHFVNTLRGQAKTMLQGQAAGTAAALSARLAISPSQLDVTVLQEALRSQGGYLGGLA